MAISTEQDTRLINAWVPRELAELLDEAAREADRSRSAEVRIALRAHLERDGNDNEMEEARP